MDDKFNKYKNMYKLNQNPFDQTQQMQFNTQEVNRVIVAPQQQIVQPKAFNPFNTAAVIVPQAATQSFVPVTNQQITRVVQATPQQVIPAQQYVRRAVAVPAPMPVINPVPQQQIVQPRVQYVPVNQTQQIPSFNQNNLASSQIDYDPIKERYKKEIRGLTAELEILKLKTEQKQKAKTKFEIKMGKLEKLLRLHYITKEEYERKKKELIKQAINSI